MRSYCNRSRLPVVGKAVGWGSDLFLRGKDKIVGSITNATQFMGSANDMLEMVTTPEVSRVLRWLFYGHS